MKIKLSKSQWELVGKKAGWDKVSQQTLPPSPQTPAQQPAQGQTATKITIDKMMQDPEIKGWIEWIKKSNKYNLDRLNTLEQIKAGLQKKGINWQQDPYLLELISQ